MEWTCHGMLTMTNFSFLHHLTYAFYFVGCTYAGFNVNLRVACVVCILYRTYSKNKQTPPLLPPPLAVDMQWRHVLCNCVSSLLV